MFTSLLILSIDFFSPLVRWGCDLYFKKKAIESGHESPFHRILRNHQALVYISHWRVITSVYCNSVIKNKNSLLPGNSIHKIHTKKFCLLQPHGILSCKYHSHKSIRSDFLCNWSKQSKYNLNSVKFLNRNKSFLFLNEKNNNHWNGKTKSFCYGLLMHKIYTTRTSKAARV